METEPTQRWMWEMKKKNSITSSDCFQPRKEQKPSSYEESWEEQAFAKDSGHVGGCVWPPRSYSCSFCKREFRSAQALGGHMNVHRRDRARLKHESLQPQMENRQIPAKNNPFTSPSHLHHLHHHPSQLVCDSVCKPNPKSSSSWVSAFKASPTRNLMEESGDCGGKGNGSKEVARNPIIFHKWLQTKELTNTTSGGETYRSLQKPRTVNSTDGKEDAVLCKRKRADAPSVAFFLSSTKSEVLSLSPTAVDDLDLELRLGGGRPKPKLK